jgi:hypothetical protein
VEAITERGVEPVYNIEVEGDHCYRVGEQGVLAHNQSTTAATPCECTASALYSAPTSSNELHLGDFKTIKCEPKSQIIYVLFDGSFDQNLTLKIGTTTIENLTSGKDTRWKDYGPAVKYLSGRRQVKFHYVCFKCPGTAESYEQQIRDTQLATYLMPWDNEKQRLGRVGEGTPGKQSSRWKREGYKWWPDEKPSNILSEYASVSIKGESYRQVTFAELSDLLTKNTLAVVAKMFSLESKPGIVRDWLTNGILKSNSTPPKSSWDGWAELGGEG